MCHTKEQVAWEARLLLIQTDGKKQAFAGYQSMPSQATQPQVLINIYGHILAWCPEQGIYRDQ